MIEDLMVSAAEYQELMSRACCLVFDTVDAYPNAAAMVRIDAFVANRIRYKRRSLA